MTRLPPGETSTAGRGSAFSVIGRHSVTLLGGLFVVLATVLAYVLATGNSPPFDVAVAFSLSAGPGAVLIYRSYQLPAVELDPQFYPIIGAWCFGSAVVTATTLGFYHLQPAAGDLTEPTRTILNIASLSSVAGYGIGYHDARARTRANELERRNEQLRRAQEELAEANERLERRNDQLRQARAELAESNERLEQFAYVASHDLQEPLRMVSSYLQLLEDRYAEELDADAEEFIEFAVDGAERMRAMIDDLLAYSRVDTRADPLEPTEADAVVENALRNLERQIEESDAEIHVESLPTVLADRNQLRQVFQNLVSNAIKYSGDEPPVIEIGADRDGGEWVFRVADNGVGMAPDQTERIFDVFERLHSTEEQSGTGIGLALCQKIVDRHGGNIWVESESGEGSTFYFTIPDAEHSREPGTRTGDTTTVAEGIDD